MTRRLFVFGLGFTGLEVARCAQQAGWTVAGTCRTAEKAARLRAEGIAAEVFDGTAAPADGSLLEASHILCTIAPGKSGDPVLRQYLPPLRAARWLGYLSTTGVYGDRGGAWVDEETAPAPAQPRSIERLATEGSWQAFAASAGLSLDIFRLPGIYGPGRSTIDQVQQGRGRRIDKPGQVFSRIHVADIAATVLAAMTRQRPAQATIYNVADDLPASPADVTAYACELLGVPVPPLMAWEQAAPEMSEMARSFYAESRRVRNERMKRDLGVTLRYPTYREGLRAIVAG